MKEKTNYIGHKVNRLDAIEKVTGEIKYMSDLYFPDMLYGKILRSQYPHALIRRIETSKAKAVEGVHAVITWEDVPGFNGFGIATPDQPVLSKDHIRYIGEAVAAVAAKSEEIAEKACALIEVEYEELPIVDNPIDALKESAPKIHENGNLCLHTEIKRGNIEKGFQESALIVENTYYTGRQEHAFLETEGGVAHIDTDGTLVIQVGSQYPQRDQLQLARCLGINPQKIRVISYPVGGGFGGKDELTIQPILALLTLKTGKPVKMVLSREESIISYWKRHPFIMHYKTGIDKEGKIVAQEVKIYEDKGAYSSLGGPVLNLAVEHACGPYRVENVHIDGYAAFTNNGVCGAFRGFGVPQVTFAMETQMDIISEKLGIDPIRLRKINALQKGDTTPIGNKLTTSVGTLKVLESIEECNLWKRRNELSTQDPKKPWIKRGVGLALTYQGTGLGVGLPDYGGAKLELREDGGFTVKIGTVDYGQGILTAYAQIVAETMRCPIEKVKVTLGDTALTADCGPTSASRGVYTGGKASIIAAEEMIQLMKNVATPLLQASADFIDCDNGFMFLKGEPLRKVSYKEIANKFIDDGKPLPETEGYFLMPIADIEIKNAFGLPHHIFAFSAHVAYVEVNTLTGETRVLQGAEAVDGGVVINKQGYEGQVEGGFVMGLGYALMEDVIIDRGQFKNVNFSTYIIPTVKDTPFHIESIPVINPEDTGPFKAKGIAETVMVATAPAITNAIYRATGTRLYRIPATPEYVYKRLKEVENEKAHKGH